MKQAKPKRHYVNNPDLYKAIVEYREKLAGNPEERVPNYIGVCIMQICERLSTKPNFGGYTYRDEMVSDGIENCIKAVKGFNPEKSNNPFAYFTQIAWNSFIRRITLEKQETYVKHKNMMNSAIMGELMDPNNHGVKPNEFSDEIVRNFEEKVRLTKAKKSDKVNLEKFTEETD